MPNAIGVFSGVVWIELDQSVSCRAPQSNLRNAIAAAKVYFGQRNTYSGFDAVTGTAIEPLLTWADGANIAVNVVSARPEGVRWQTDRIVVQTLSPWGTSYCIGDDPPSGTVRGVDRDGGSFADYGACAAAEDW